MTSLSCAKIELPPVKTVFSCGAENIAFVHRFFKKPVEHKGVGIFLTFYEEMRLC